MNNLVAGVCRRCLNCKSHFVVTIDPPADPLDHPLRFAQIIMSETCPKCGSYNVANWCVSDHGYIYKHKKED